VTAGSVSTVAAACLLGIPAERLVYGDTLERLYWDQVTLSALEQDGTRRDNQATATANAIGELLRRMFRRRRAR
jgi:hypothetical protein